MALQSAACAMLLAAPERVHDLARGGGPVVRAAVTAVCEGMMRVRFAGVFALAFGLGAAGCGSDDPTGSYEGPLLGTWDAVEVDGQPVPATHEAIIEGVVCTFRVDHLEFTFQANARYVGRDEVTAQCHDQPPADLSRNFGGRFRTVGGTLLLTPDGSVEQSAQFAIDDNILTIIAGEGEDRSETVLRRR
jgi:hypothetical protein